MDSISLSESELVFGFMDGRRFVFFLSLTACALVVVFVVAWLDADEVKGCAAFGAGFCVMFRTLFPFVVTFPALCCCCCCCCN